MARLFTLLLLYQSREDCRITEGRLLWVTPSLLRALASEPTRSVPLDQLLAENDSCCLQRARKSSRIGHDG